MMELFIGAVTLVWFFLVDYAFIRYVNSAWRGREAGRVFWPRCLAAILVYVAATVFMPWWYFFLAIPFLFLFACFAPLEEEKRTFVYAAMTPAVAVLLGLLFMGMVTTSISALVRAREIPNTIYWSARRMFPAERPDHYLPAAAGPETFTFSRVTVVEKDGVLLRIPVPDGHEAVFRSSDENHASFSVGFTNGGNSTGLTVQFEGFIAKEGNSALLAGYRRKYSDHEYLADAVARDVKADYSDAWIPVMTKVLSQTNEETRAFGVIDAKVEYAKNRFVDRTYLPCLLATRDYFSPCMIIVNREVGNRFLAVGWMEEFLALNGERSLPVDNDEVASAVKVKGRVEAERENELLDPASFFVAPQNDPAMPYSRGERVKLVDKTYVVPIPRDFTHTIDNKGIAIAVEMQDREGTAFTASILGMNFLASLVESNVDAKALFESGKKSVLSGSVLPDSMPARFIASMKEKGLEAEIASVPRLVQNTADSAVAYSSLVVYPPGGDKNSGKIVHLFETALLLSGDVVTVYPMVVSASEEKALRVAMTWINRFIAENQTRSP